MDNEAFYELVSAVADEIRSYLIENTAAGDTASGIRQWWLPEPHKQVDVAIVEQALERLVAQGLVTVRVLPSGANLYFGLGGKMRGEI